MAKETEFIVILNRDSGDEADKPGPAEIERAFARHGGTVSVLPVSGEPDFAARIDEAIGRRPRCVVAAGGDGTISAVAGALVGTGIELGVIPLGTFNYFARRCGIPEDFEASIDVICRGRRGHAVLGSVNGQIFLNNASLGLYPSILRERERTYRRWGRSRLAAYWSVILTMATIYRPMTMHIEVDGTQRWETSPNLFVAVSAYQLDEFGIEGAEAIREGRFALLIAPDCGRFMLVWKALRIAVSGLRAGRDFTLVTGRNVTITTGRRKSLVAMDGERREMTAPFTFSILEDALVVRLPENGTEEAGAA
ncbi:MAG: diacylglycerol/lipid kinase family protein [Roseicyclus sp.]